jgi:hypothetical protein
MGCKPASYTTRDLLPTIMQEITEDFVRFALRREDITIRLDVHPRLACACGNFIVHGFDADGVGGGIRHGQIPTKIKRQTLSNALQFE